MKLLSPWRPKFNLPAISGFAFFLVACSLTGTLNDFQNNFGGCVCANNVVQYELLWMITISHA